MYKHQKYKKIPEIIYGNPYLPYYLIKIEIGFLNQIWT
jgi:hypothetical protein